MNKEEMEQIWRERSCRQINALCKWQWRGKILKSFPGTPKNTAKGAAAATFWASREMRKLLGGHNVPSWNSMQRRQDIEPSAELVAKMKYECPRNWRGLIAAFGRTRTKYDAPLAADYQPLFIWATRNDPVRRGNQDVSRWEY